MKIHHNFTTHRDAWRKGIEHLSQRADLDEAERAYWKHELKAFDEAFATIKNCRDDGRCQYAIDHGAEGLASCPTGKCVMPDAEGGDVIDLAQKRTPRVAVRSIDCIDLTGELPPTTVVLDIKAAHRNGGFIPPTDAERKAVSLPLPGEVIVKPAAARPKNISDDLALIMEAYDMGQFASDTLGIGGSSHGLAEPVRAALCRLIDKRYKELYGPNAENSEIGYNANTIYIVVTDSEGKRAITSSRSTSTPHLDYKIMDAALDFEQAKRLRNVDIQPHKVGELWMTTIKPLTAPDHTALLGDACLDAMQISNDAELLAKLRGVCGYIENGGGDSVTIAQDDATREWGVYVGSNGVGRAVRAYHANSFHQAIVKAAEAEGDKS